MTTDSGDATWLIAFGSVPGPKRVVRQTTNQDSLAVKALAEAPDSPVAAAVADGHGAAKYVRSRVGAEIATGIATSELLSIAASEVDASITMTDIKRAVTERLPLVLSRNWIDRVTQHYRENPLTDAERATISSSRGTRLADIETAPHQIYGSTLLAVLLTTTYAAFVQLGDGEIIAAETGLEVQSVFDDDPRALGDETASLASPQAWRDIQVSFYPFVQHPPALVILTTDGYGKAFTTKEAFRQVGADMLSLAQDEGFNTIQEELTTWLEEAGGISGDDATAIVLGHSSSVLKRLPPARSDGHLDDRGRTKECPGDSGSTAAIDAPEEDTDTATDVREEHQADAGSSERPSAHLVHPEAGQPENVSASVCTDVPERGAGADEPSGHGEPEEDVED